MVFTFDYQYSNFFESISISYIYSCLKSLSTCLLYVYSKNFFFVCLFDVQLYSHIYHRLSIFMSVIPNSLRRFYFLPRYLLPSSLSWYSFYFSVFFQYFSILVLFFHIPYYYILL